MPREMGRSMVSCKAEDNMMSIFHPFSRTPILSLSSFPLLFVCLFLLCFPAYKCVRCPSFIHLSSRGLTQSPQQPGLASWVFPRPSGHPSPLTLVFALHKHRLSGDYHGVVISHSLSHQPGSSSELLGCVR